MTHSLRCGYKKHLYNSRCPAEGAQCRYCGGFNHFSRSCIKTGNDIISKELRVNKLQDNKSMPSESGF